MSADANRKRHDGSGRFLPGCPPGPGRPKRATEEAYIRALTEVINEDVFRSMLRRLVGKALKGELAAIKLVLRYTLPRMLHVELLDEGLRVAGSDSENAENLYRRLVDRVNEERQRMTAAGFVFNAATGQWQLPD